MHRPGKFFFPLVSPLAIFFALVLNLSGPINLQAGDPPESRFSPRDTPDIRAAVPFGKLPLVIEENRGQADSHFRYLARAPGYTAFFADTEIAFLIHDDSSRTANVRMRITGAASAVHPRGLDLLPGRSHYYIGRDPRQWHTNVPQYAGVQYADAYAGIDLEFHGKRQAVEFDFLVHPGADVSAIEMEFAGAEKLEMDSTGALVVHTPVGALRFEAPELYQEVNHARRAVAGGFVQKANGRWGFHADSYDRRYPLVIDPVIRYATFFMDQFFGVPLENPRVAVDPAGNIFLAGSAVTDRFPTKNALQSTLSGSDAYIAKFDSTGTQLVFATFFGGGSGESLNAAVADAASNLYIAGNTTSNDFPTTPGVVERNCPSPCASAWVAKLGPIGTLEFSTLLGGNPSIRDVAVDSAGQVYLTGTIGFGSVPLVNPIQVSGSGVIQKLNADASAFVYSTRLGGNSSTFANAIAADADGNAYVAGADQVFGTITPPGFPLKNPLVVSGSAFLMKIPPTGGDVVFSTKLGDFGIADMDVDAQGSAVVVGSTEAGDLPLTPKAFLTTCYPLRAAPCLGEQLLAMKVNASGTGLVYSTLLGKGFASHVAVDAGGNAYVAMGSVVPLVDPLQKDVSGLAVAKLDPAGNPIYISRLGATFSSSIQTDSVSTDGNGNLYVAGKVSATNSDPLDFPLVNPFESTIPCCGAKTANFVVKIGPENEPGVSLSPGTGNAITLRNVGTAPLQVSSIMLNNQPVTRGDCGSVVPPGESCTLEISVGTLTVTSNAAGSPHTAQIPESRFSVPELLVWPSTALWFSARLSGHESSPQVVTIRNPSTTPLTFQEFRAGENFQQTNDCGSMLAPYSRCRVWVTHRPGSNPGVAGGLTIFYNNTLNAYRLFLFGSTSSTAAILSTPSVNFGIRYTGGMSLPRVVTVANVASDTVRVTGVSVTGDFAQTNDCVAPLPPEGRCFITVTFVPTRLGTREGTLTVMQSGPGGALSAALTGVSLTASDLSISPRDLILFYSATGTTSFGQNLTVKNDGSNPVDLVSVTTTGEFAVDNPCPATLAPGGSCVLVITFTPSVLGSQEGELRIEHTGMGSPSIVPLQGEGRPPLRFYPEEPDAGEQAVGGSKPFFVSVSGYSSTPLTITGATASGDFSILSSSCTQPVSAFFSCGYSMAFTPTATGLRTGTLTVTVAETPEPSVVMVRGTGVSAGAVTLSPASLDFGSIPLGSASSSQTVTLTNSGSGPLAISGIETSTFYSQTHNCGATLASGDSCTISVQFTPGVAGLQTGTLTVWHDAPGGPHTVALLGSAQSPAVSLSPASLGFSEQEVGTASSAREMLLSNVGNVTLLISGFATSGDFSATTTCGGSLGPGESCPVQIRFQPTATGVRAGSVVVTTNSPGSPDTIALGGTGVVRPLAGLSRTSLLFGTVLARIASSPQEVVLTNGGGSPMNLVTVGVVGGAFSQTNDCPATLAPGGSCRVQITFTPPGAGMHSAGLRFESNAPGSPHDVSLVGTGTEYLLGVVPGTPATATVDAGQTANYSLVLTAAPGSQEVLNLTCAGAPTGAACTVSPARHTLSGEASVNVSVTVTTRARAAMLPRLKPSGPQPFGWPVPILMLLVLTLLALTILEGRHRLTRLRPAACLLALAGIVLLLHGCGGGGGSSPPPPPPPLPGTPPGTYTLTLTAAPPSSSSQQPAQTLPLTLVVR